MKRLKPVASQADSRYGGARDYHHHSPSSSLHVGHAPVPVRSSLVAAARVVLVGVVVGVDEPGSRAILLDAGFVLTGLFDRART